MLSAYLCLGRIAEDPVPLLAVVFRKRSDPCKSTSTTNELDTQLVLN